jgi:hypothetical protein
MASRWPGIRSELELGIAWRFAFVPTGTRVEPSHGAVYLDVGGELRPGVVDHHQGSVFACSTARLVLRHPHFVFDHLAASLRADLAAGVAGPDRPWRPTLVTHGSPDFDAIVSAHLCRHLVEHGEFPAYAESLVAYADAVDQGRRALTSDSGSSQLYPLVLMLLAVAARPSGGALEQLAAKANVDAGSKDEKVLRIGFELVSLWAERWSAFRKEPGRDGRSRSAADDMDLDLAPTHRVVPPLLEELANDRKVLDDLVAASRIVYRAEPVRLPEADGDGSHDFGSAVIPETESCALNKLYLRAGIGGPAPAPLTVIRIGGGPDRRPHGWTIALDPSAAIEHGASLRGLGAALEAAEQEARTNHGQLDPRRGVARYPEFPGIADPWYDGRGHDFTIVDAPRAGSVLGLADVERILSSRFWEPGVARSRVVLLGRVFDSDGGETRVCEDCGDCSRLHALRECIERVRAGGGVRSDAAPILVSAEISRSWGDAPIRKFVQFVTGDVLRSFDVEGCETWIGRAGCVVSIGLGGDRGERLFKATDRMERLLRPVVALLEEMRRIEEELETVRQRLPRSVMRRHVVAVVTFRRDFSAVRGASGAELAEAVLDAFGVETAIDRVGRLLEHVDDDARRRRDAILNRVVFMVGLLGLVEAAQIAAAGFWAWRGGRDGLEDWPWYLALMLPLLFLAIVFLGLFALSRRGSQWIARMAPRLRIQQVHPLFFDDIDTDARPRD